MNLAVDIIATAQAMNARGINTGTSGNVSARTPTGMLITPSGLEYSQLTPDDIVAMDFDTSWFATKDLRPSSEWRFHLDILRSRHDVNAIVHTHSTYATALAVHGRGIGSFHYMVATAGGRDIRCAPYATFGSQELSNAAIEALDGRHACLLSHHGVITTGVSLSAALLLAVTVEELARQYVAALAIGEPQQLSDEEMDEVIVKMQTTGYGSTPPRESAVVVPLDR
ncbi:MAG: class II aldolase/adducin family protein [Acidimicrobiales bacterium]